MTSSWFFLSTLNYDARSATHQILLSVRLPNIHYYAQPLRSDTKFHIHAELIAALQLIQNIQTAVVYKPAI